MRVDELFLSTEKNKVAKLAALSSGAAEYIEWDNRMSEDEKKAALKALTDEYLDEINKIQEGHYKKDTPQDYVIVVVREMCPEESGEDTVRLNSAKLYRDDFKKADGFDMDDPYSFVNPMVSVLFDSRKNIYNAEISDASMKRYDKHDIAACILREMCFFGIREEDRNKNTKEELDKLEKAIDQAENKEGVPMDDVFKMLGFEDTRTPEEKKKRREEIRSATIKTIRETISVIKETVKFMDKEE